MKIFSVYDVKAGAFSNPMFSRNNSTAMRSFAAAVNMEDTEFNHHAEDYSLFCVGEWDELGGKISGQTPVQIVTALEVMQEAILGPLVPMGGE